MFKFKKRKKSALAKSFYLGKTSVCVICVSVFFSAVVIGTCLMSRSTLETYAKVNVAEARSLLNENSRASRGEDRKLAQEIVIGRGVSLSESCQVKKTSIICE